ncbi:MAG: HAMP domain-containing sensor histidine kinase [Pseudomonadota bacterium]
MIAARARRSSIALPIFALTVVSVLLTAILLFVVTFRGPPPRPAPLRLETIAQVLRDGRAPPPGEMRMTLVEGASVSLVPNGWAIDTTAQTILAQTIRAPRADVRVVTLESQHQPFMIRGPFAAGLRTQAGWRVLQTQPQPIFTRWHWWTLQAMAMACVILGIAAWLIARAITRPLADLAQAASHGRVGQPIAVPDRGPREVRDLGDALSAMHLRLARHADSRTAMLAAIAHDLGTPLSRIAFWIEQLPEPARVRAAGDIAEMRAMLGDVLRFARDERVSDSKRIDLGSLLDALVEDLSVAGQPATIDPGPRALVRGDSTGLRRLFANLIENAIRYGDVARVGWQIADGEAIVTIDDAGPGFDPKLGDQLFEPFVRGDPSRNRATGGTGLGLAIVRSLAEAHGGRVTLGQASGGGGQVEVRLPLA